MQRLGAMQSLSFWQGNTHLPNCVLQWAVAHWAAVVFAGMASMRDEVALGLLIVTGALVYGGAILLLFGPRWLRTLVRP